jgi:hypothetical protein
MKMEEKIFEMMIWQSPDIAASEITAHVMEFIKWLLDNDSDLYCYIQNDEELVIDYETTYQYWLNNVKKSN